MVWYHSEAILLALKQDPEVAHLAATYLRWAVLGLPAYELAVSIDLSPASVE